MSLYLRFFIIITIFSITIPSVYDVGEQISESHQNTHFDVCHGAEEHGYGDELNPNLSLGDFNGFNNGGIFYVTMIDMAASW
ncbi:uncharacterized protein METZ01_LOCUS456540 [marine metagenome]|uniref:Uncharacterized protein n=1 Tax=marine metagenome TaxID=408172 RepID=A0A383A726_9ZZZZ